MKTMIRLFIAILLITGCGSLKPQQPDITLEAVRPLNFSLSGQRLAVTLNVSNPNAFNLALRNVDLTATLNGEPIATGVSDTAVTIPANGEQLVELEVTAGLDVALGLLRSALEQDQSSLAYGVNGNVRMSRWPFPIPFESDGQWANPLATETR